MDEEQINRLIELLRDRKPIPIDEILKDAKSQKFNKTKRKSHTSSN